MANPWFSLASPAHRYLRGTVPADDYLRELIKPRWGWSEEAKEKIVAWVEEVLMVENENFNPPADPKQPWIQYVTSQRKTLLVTESFAVEKLQQGSAKYLAQMLLEPEVRAELSQNTWQALADYLTKKLKGKRKRPRMSMEERYASNRVHELRDMFLIAEDILRRGYGEEVKVEYIKSMALHVTCATYGLTDRAEKRLLSNLSHKRGDPKYHTTPPSQPQPPTAAVKSKIGFKGRRQLQPCVY